MAGSQRTGRAVATRLLIVACVFFATTGGKVRSAEGIAWKSGAALTKALQASVGFTWSERPLREGLTSLGQNSSVAMLLDRRVDPSQPITYAVRDMALSDALKELAQAYKLSVGMVGPVVYVGPAGKAGQLQGLATLRKRELPAGTTRQRWLDPQPMAWDELAEPRSLAASIAKLADAEVANLDAIPHDVWSAWSGPDVAPVDQLSLVLGQFDLTFELSEDGRTVTVVPAPENSTYEQSYKITGDAAKTVNDLQRILPEIKTRRASAGRITVEATAEQHAKIAQLLAGQRTTTKTVTKPGKKTYTLTVENQPIGAVVKAVAGELGVEVKADAELAEKLQQRTSLQVKQLSADDLLHKVLDPVGIEFKLSDDALELHAKESME